MQSPFKIPEDTYFEQLETKLNRIPTWQVPRMETPADYFAQIEDRILSQTVDVTKKGKVKKMWVSWFSAAAAVLMVGGIWYFSMPQNNWEGVSNADILVYMEEHQSTALPVDEMTVQFDAQSIAPLEEMTEQDIQAYDELYGI
ncbi:MAG: hypothetical protein ACK4LB_07245 [Spirosomataceae bacterium]